MLGCGHSGLTVILRVLGPTPFRLNLYHIMQQAWDQAWANARPAFDSIRASLPLSTSSDPRIMRVGQLDSELLDQELANILQEPLGKSLALVNVCPANSCILLKLTC